MIEIVCNDQTYTYNAYHITKAFYPEADFTTRIEEKASNFVSILFEDGDALSVGPDDFSANDITKKQVDKLMYKLLQKKSGKELAWGILTGVRPTKIAMKKMEEGMTEEEFVPWFMEESYVTEGKAALAWKIVGREKALLDQLDYDNGYSLYVGIPFCPSVCSYCSFSSGALEDWKSYVQDYVDALCKEISYVGEKSGEKSLNTIYVGGGTPTSITAKQLDQILTCIDEHFSKEHLLEYTVEAGRPDSITEEKLEVIRSHGISRISINPQTMQQKTLDLVGRKHTVWDVVDIFHMAREMGFDNINMDLIAGLPGETLADMEDTLEKIKELSPDNLTVHSLAIKRAAKMGQEHYENYTASTPIGDMVRVAFAAAEDMDMSPYYLYRQKNIAGNFENVGYAKVDKAGIYNILIMEEKQSIIACGAGASTKIVLKEKIENPVGQKGKTTNLIRQENVKAIDAYINRIDEMIERKGEWLWH